MKRIAVILCLALACAVLGWAAYRAAAPATQPLSRYVPAGPLLYLETKSFSSLLSDWNSSPQKQQWIQSGSYEVFSRSRLFLRLKGASDQFAAAAGLPPDMSFLSQVSGERSVLAGNLLDRQFQAESPNQKWVADFTYIWTAEGWLYVSVVLDLYSRRVVGWSMQSSMTSQLVADALMMAVWRRGKPMELLHHSDQGSQYTSEHFQELLKEQGITCSMSRAGEVWDNSAMESFFSSLKTERTARKVFRTREQARAEVFDYVERFYNPTRRHSTLGYVSPIAFEKAREA